MTSFAVLIHDADEDAWESLSDAEKQRTYDTDEEFGRLLAERGGTITGGAELTHSREARVVRRGGAVTEGPFAETAEVLSGFYLVSDVEEAVLVELADVLTRVHDVVEIRPLPTYS